VLAACAAAGLLAGCSGSPKPPKVAATVEGATVSSADISALMDAYRHRQTISTDPSTPELKAKQLRQTVLSFEIKLTFLEQLAKRMRVTTPVNTDAAAAAVDPQAFAAFGFREEDFARSLRAGRLSRAIAEQLFPAVTVSDTAVREEFDRRAAEPFRPWKAEVKMARFNAQAPADAVRGRVAAGETFDQVTSVLGAAEVAEVDVDPNVTELPAPVFDAIGALNASQVSQGVKTSTGWLAILVEHRDTVPKPTFEEVRPEITAYLIDQERSRLFQDWFSKQFSAAHVTVARYYGTWNAQLHVVV
jgi:hypothetical protein